MKIGSLQFKFLLTVISAILAIAVFVGGLSIYELDNYIQQQTRKLLNTTCSNEVSEINDVFGDMEKSVRIMESYALSFFDGVEDAENRDKQDEVIEFVDKMFADVAINTSGAIAYYLRFDPQISHSTAGVFYSKINGGDEYIRFEPTDISLYDKDDTEHVGWFWQPYEAGEPIWMSPYYNQNNNVFMISYVVPLYCESQFIGVVGMDFDYTVLTEKVHEIKIYENGFAHLELDGTVIHYGEENIENTDEASDEYLRVAEELDNGMTLVVSASCEDIRQTRYDVAYKILLFVVLVALIFSLIVFFMVKKIVKPLKKLTDASVKLSSGDYDVEIEHSNTYEIKLLSAAFTNMITNLKEHEKLQHLLAYRDSLTGLRNTTSYKDWITDFNKKIKDGLLSFGVVVFDINYLKETNDTYGHNAGNKLILTAARIISSIFKRSPVFRIGGDEFAVILQGKDYEAREELFARFEEECHSAALEEDGAILPVSVARGFSEFDPQKDTQFSDVFERADEEMYENKKNTKETQI